MINYKQLCVELVRIVDALDSKTPLAANQGQALDGYAALAAFRDVANRARAELAKPEPKGPSDEELNELLYFGFTTSTGHGSSEDSIGFARAVLARWGNHLGSPDSSLQPIPVSERLPEPEDCDNGQNCRVWCWSWDIGAWTLSRIDYVTHSHWLPAHVLPVPS